MQGALEHLYTNVAFLGALIKSLVPHIWPNAHPRLTRTMPLFNLTDLCYELLDSNKATYTLLHFGNDYKAFQTAGSISRKSAKEPV